MKIALRILLGFLCFHTAVGAIWKWSNSEHTMPTLGAIPHALWLAMSAIEVLCAIAFLIALLDARRAIVAAVAAAIVAIEMLLFTGVHLASGSTSMGPVIYWLVIAVVCGIVMAGGLRRKPLG